MITHFLHTRLKSLGSDTSGVALLEFAFMLPILLLMSLAGAELTNYIITRMRVSQLALHIADNAARIGSGSQLQAKTINEADIYDLFEGANFQSEELDLKARGRVILTDVEPMEASTTRYKIGWTRCFGDQRSYVKKYPKPGDATTDLTGIGPTGRQAIAPSGGATMFVEVYYKYRPLIETSFSPAPDMIETAAMMVRDRRDLTGGDHGVYPVAGLTPLAC